MMKAFRVTVLGLALAVASGVRFAPAAEIRLEAAVNAVGEEFTVDVYVADAADLYGLGFKVV